MSCVHLYNYLCMCVFDLSCMPTCVKMHVSHVRICVYLNEYTSEVFLDLRVYLVVMHMCA